MRYVPRLARMLPLIPLLAMPACGHFVAAPRIAASPDACVSLLPEEWRKGVPGASLPDGDTLADWIAFGDRQTGQLDKSNDRIKAAIGIVERCEARDAAAVRAASRRRFLDLF